jgi:hypothetical protein
MDNNNHNLNLTNTSFSSNKNSFLQDIKVAPNAINDPQIINMM